MLLRRSLTEATARCPPLETFAERLHDRCAVRLRDVVDHVLCRDRSLWAEFVDSGWDECEHGLLRHRGGWFPDVLDADTDGLVLKVESVEHFLSVSGVRTAIEGDRWGPYRRAAVAATPGAFAFWVAERNGHPGYDIPAVARPAIRAARIHWRAWRRWCLRRGCT